MAEILRSIHGSDFGLDKDGFPIWNNPSNARENLTGVGVNANGDDIVGPQGALGVLPAASYINTSGVNVASKAGATWADKLDAAVAELQGRGAGYLRVPGSTSMTLTRKFRLPVGRFGADLDGALIDITPITSGRGIEIIPDAVDSKIQSLFAIGVNILASESQSTQTDCLYIGRPDDMAYGNTAGLTLTGLRIRGGRDGLTYGPHAWLVELRDFIISHCARRTVGFGTGSEGAYNAGEQMTLRHGVLADTRNDAGTATLIEMALGYAGTVTVDGVSFDYSDVDVIVRAGHLNIVAPHGENNAVLPNIRRIYTNGQSHPPTVNIIGGSLGNYWDRLAEDKEGAGGKDSYIQNEGGGSGGIYLTAVSLKMYERSKTEIIKSDTDIPLNVKNCNFEIQTNATPYLSKRVNAVQDPQFLADPLVWLAPMENHIANGAMDGPYTSGRPSGFAVAGALSGVTQTLSVDIAAGYPRLKVTLSGTASSAGSVGVYLNGASSVASEQNQRWIGSSYISFEKSTGITEAQANMVDRNAGAGNGNSVTAHAVSRRRKRIEGTRASAANTTHVQFGIQVSVANGAAVDAIYYIDTPTLRPEYCTYADHTYDSAASAVLPSGRSRRVSSGGIGGASALEITNSGTGVCSRYQDIAIREGERLWVRGMVKGTISAGTYGFRTEWLDREGNVISTRDWGGLLTATVADFTQRGDIRHAPAGTTRARLHCLTDGVNGVVLFGEAYAWVV